VSGKGEELLGRCEGNDGIGERKGDKSEVCKCCLAHIVIYRGSIVERGKGRGCRGRRRGRGEVRT
jgi:hypothetical protein